MNRNKYAFNKVATEQPPIWAPVVFGLVVLMIFVGGFLIWSNVSPLESAAIAEGKIIVDTNRKTIEHLEGGVIKTLHVRDGSKVKRGDLLLELENTHAQSRFDLLTRQANEYLAQEARLLAERDGADGITFPAVLNEQQSDLEVAKVMKAQRAIFTANRETFEGQLTMLEQGVLQLRKEIESLDAQVASETRQLELIKEQIEAVAYLEARKLIEKPRLLELQREEARLQGNQGEALGLIARAEQRIGEMQTRMYTLEDSRLQETLQQLSEVRLNLNNVLEQQESAKDVLHRTKIVAPQSGTIVSLQKHTVGGVVSPSEEIMGIVPSDDELTLEARIDPLDIDVVQPGLLAKVQLTAFKQRTTPTLNGTVEHISADSFQDSNTGATYYTARITIDPEELEKLKHIQLYPGMPAQVMIIVDKRTPFQYFITPIKESFGRAFREQ